MTAIDGVSALAFGINQHRERFNAFPARIELAKDVYTDIRKSAHIPTQDRTRTIMGIEFSVSPIIPDGFAVFLDRAGNVVGMIDCNAQPDA